MASSPNARVSRLPSGLTVVLAPDHRSPVVSFHVWVKVGSADERPDEAGLAHVLEHMLFKGTARRGVGAIAQEIEGSGGEINAYTSFDSTVYYAVVASRFFETGLDVIADTVTRPLLDANELALEKEVILEEIKRDADQPGRRATHALFGLSFRKHPYGRPVIGYRETVAGFERARVAAFYERWYEPGNMVLVVAGDFREKDAAARVKAAFAGFSRPKAPARRRPVEPLQKGFRGAAIPEEISEVHLECAFHIPALLHADVPALDLLAIALGQGDRSRLPWRVRRTRQLVTGIGASAFTPTDPGLFLVSASMSKERATEGATESLRELFSPLAEPVTDEELSRAKVSVEGDLVYERETVQGVARKLGYYQSTAGGLAQEARYLAAVRRCTAEDLTRVARTYLKPEGLTASVVGPREALPTLASLEEAARAGASAPTRRRRAKLISHDTEERVVLPGGATLLVRREPAVPLVALRAVFLGGLRFEDEATAGITHLLARVQCKGTASRSYSEIVRAVDRFAGGVSGFSGLNSFGLRMDALSRHLPEVSELFCDLLRDPLFEEREVEEEKRQVLEALKAAEDQPAHLAMRAFTRSLYRSHPYRLPILGEAKQIPAFGSAALTSFYRRLAVPQNLSLAVVGDVDPKEVVDRFGDGLAGFGAGRGLVFPAVPAEPKPDAPREVVVHKEKEQAHLVVGFLGLSFTDQERHALELAASALSGQGGRLFMELRDRQGLAYSLSAFSQEALDPGYFAVYLATDSAKLPRALEAVKGEISRLVTDGLSAEELSRNQRQLVGSFEIDLQRASNRAANMAFNDRYGLGFQEYREYSRRILAVTREEIVEVSRRILDLDRAVVAVVRPESEAAAAPVAASASALR